MTEERCYWDGVIAKRIGRRGLLRAAALGSAGAALAAAGCGHKSESAAIQGAATGPAAPQPGGTLMAMLRGNPPSLDPQQTSSDYTMPLAGTVMSRLLRFQTGKDIQTGLNHSTEPDLAASVESPDAVTWTIKLRHGAKFHDVSPVNGHAVEAEDIKASYTRAFTEPKDPYKGLLGSYLDPTQIETPATDTVVFKLKHPYSPFRSALASANYGWIFPREVLTGGFDPTKQMIGSGPFVFDHITPDVEVAFKKNPEWYENGRPLVDGLRYAIITDGSQQEAQFSVGHLDILPVYVVTDLPTLKQNNPKATDISVPPGSLGSVWFQLGNPDSPWLDIRLRQAVSMAIDRPTIGKVIFGGDDAIAFNLGASFGKWSLSMSDLPSDVAQYYSYNPSEAKKLLDAAGGSNLGNVSLAYAVPIPNANTQQIVETVNSMLNAVGFKTVITPIDYTTVWLNGGKGVRYGYKPNNMLVLSGMEGADDVDDYMTNYFSSQASNPSHLSDPALDAMIQKARTVINEDDRVKAYKDIQLYIVEKVYNASGIPQARGHTLVQPRVQNYEYSGSLGAATESYTKLWLQK